MFTTLKEIMPREFKELNMLAQAWNHNTQKAEAGGWQLWGQQAI